jgi:hypothetical protein
MRPLVPRRWSEVIQENLAKSVFCCDRLPCYSGLADLLQALGNRIDTRTFARIFPASVWVAPESGLAAHVFCAIGRASLDGSGA